MSARTRVGDELRTLVDEVAPDLLAYFERRAYARDDAADMVSDTLLQAWRRIDVAPLASPEQMRMWLFGIAANTLRNHHRAHRRHLRLVRRAADTRMHAPADAFEDAHEVRDAIDRLPDGQRELVMLVHWDGFTVAGAAVVLGLNPSTARSRYAAARRALRAALGVEDSSAAVQSTASV